MNRIKKIVYLDYLSITPYFTSKNLFVLLGLALFYTYLYKGPQMLMGVTYFFTLLYSTYPFMVGDESGIDPLYRVFGLCPEEVVKGRYIFALILCLAGYVIGFFLVMVYSLFFKIEVFLGELFLIHGLALIISLLIIALQYPFFFRYSYMKAKAIIPIVFLLVALGGGGVGFLVAYFESNSLGFSFSPSLLLMGGLVLWALVQYLSLKLSIKWYRQREIL